MTENIIWEKFEQWTKNLNPKQARISIFNHIRDIPYAIVPQLRNPTSGPAGMLDLNKGSCQPKHYLLAIFFQKLGIPVKYVTYPFKWKDSSVNFPDQIQAIINDLPFAYHLACKAYIKEKWILVDATWDKPLKEVEFPVNENWNGESDTINAVPAWDEIVHHTLQDRIRYEAEQRGRQSEEQKALYAEFIKRLNFWLESVRND
ncbi:MAG: transglutaminase family protein [Candidatus Omnitrophica bacterium]|nr:transglutaminase family protein [Candidatus Omnitrophota bacterium]MDD5352092.1 transglutaminase family protein [Candidatus Omnitrophota bacterium]MDD5549690.1 transglutaminase family protein [Candidatus Omnitrophota bacterium]